MSESSSFETIRTVTHKASGASVKIHSYGATILSYNNGAREHLFVSKQAVLDGSQPIRGGIPVVFPIFGPPPPPPPSDGKGGSTMPQHGFARRNTWVAVSEHDAPESAGITYQLDLKDVVAGRGEGNIWAKQESSSRNISPNDCDCTLQIAVDFNATHMTTTLKVRNTGSAAFPFQALLHTYHKIEGGAALQADQCFVRGLQDYMVVADKVTGGSSSGITQLQATSSRSITVTGEVDRVYSRPPLSSGKDIGDANVTIGVGGSSSSNASVNVVNMQASAQVDGTPVPVSCVVWNPFAEKAAGMADFGNDEYHDMLCVEPGILGDGNVLEPGKEAWLKQVIMSI